MDRELCRGTDEFTGGESCTVGRQHTGPLTVTDALTPLVAAFAAQDHQARGLALFAVDSLAAVGGALVGLLEPRLTAPALDLRQFTGGAVSPALRTDYALTAALVGGVLLLILAAAAAETLLARRRQLGAVLRLD
ncbi:hypothetical protein [Actinacidiphila sp. bgisy145]|uniref:hypothetical protein n=1 Tax=Actinacidiphila sp. bgisy145 TaxID=3413792 RepID=UPI003EBB7DE3